MFIDSSNTEVANDINTGFGLNLMCFINEQQVAFLSWSPVRTSYWQFQEPTRERNF